MWPNPCSGFSDQISAMSAGVLDTSLTCFPPEYPWSDRSSHQRCSVKKGVLREISSENSQENTCVKVAFLITFTAQKMKFSPVNVTKSAVSGGFGHIYWRNPYWKTSFFVQCLLHYPDDYQTSPYTQNANWTYIRPVSTWIYYAAYVRI